MSQIQICYQFSRELEHSDLNLNKFEELMSEDKTFSFDNLLRIADISFINFPYNCQKTLLTTEVLLLKYLSVQQGFMFYTICPYLLSFWNLL